MQPHTLRFQGIGASPSSHMNFLRLSGMGIGTIAFGRADIDVPPLEDYHLVIFCLTGSAIVHSGNIDLTIDSRSGIVCSPDLALRASFSADCEQFLLRIDRRRLAKFNGARRARLSPRIDLCSPRTQPLLMTLRNLAADPATVQLIRDNARVAEDYEQLLLRLLFSAQEEDPMGLSDTIRPRSLRRAIEFIHDHVAEDITLADIAAAADVPERTLQDAFQQFEDATPMGYLRDLRLKQARSQLLADRGDRSVTEIAVGLGINHLGRFAKTYAERFGERPSQTLRRRY
jgi:AraC-like DNA-binding protein